MVAILQALKAVRSALSPSELKGMLQDASTEVWNDPVGILEGCRRKASYSCFLNDDLEQSFF